MATYTNYWISIIEKKSNISSRIEEFLNERYAFSNDPTISLLRNLRSVIDSLLSNFNTSDLNLTGTTADYNLDIVISNGRYVITFVLL